MNSAVVETRDRSAAVRSYALRSALRLLLAPFEIVRTVIPLLRLTLFVLFSMLRYKLSKTFSLHAFGVQLRKRLDSSGLVYRKLGQYLAMRSDLVPPEICTELDHLFEDVSAMPFAEIERLLQEELRQPWRELFASFDPQPIGSASVAQVHRATSLDGEHLAVKVRRSGIKRQFRATVSVLRPLASLCDLVHLGGTIPLRAMFDEFVVFTTRELNFELEGRTADRMRKAVVPHGYVPMVRWDLTTEGVLSMEFVEGETFLTLCKLSETGHKRELEQIISGLDLHEVVTNLADECFHQLFTTGFFHGDPHPGNVILRKDGVFVFLDCGIAGELSVEHRQNLSGFVENLALGRFPESAYYYTRLCELTAATDFDAWMYDVTTAIASWHAALKDPHAPIKHRHMGHLQGIIASAVRRHHVLTRPDQLLVWRALVLLDTTTLRLPIRFDVLKALVAFFNKTRTNLPLIVQRTFASLQAEAPNFTRDVLSPFRSLSCSNRPVAIRAVRSRVLNGGASSRRALFRVVPAFMGVVCGVLAASAGEATASYLIVLAASFLLIGVRR